MKFDLQRYLAAPERFTLETGYGSQLTYLTHTAETSSQGLVLLKTTSLGSEIELYELDGSYRNGMTSELDLKMFEKPLEIEYEGMAYITETGAVIGIKVDDGGPYVIAPVKAHKCRVTVTRDPVVVSSPDIF